MTFEEARGYIIKYIFTVDNTAIIIIDNTLSIYYW